MNLWRLLTVLILYLHLFCEAREVRYCKIIPLSSRSSIKAETIFSGTVMSFFISRDSTMQNVKPKVFAARVKVKRVFRGQKSLQGKFVVVEGLGNPRICISRPRLGDTRIFFVNESRHFLMRKYGNLKTMRLRSSLLRLTLPNLRILWKLAQEGE